MLVSSLVELARSILNDYENSLRNCPENLKRIFIDSAYAVALPENIAKVLIHGFPSEKERAISSNELNIYSDAAAVLVSQLRNLNTVATNLSVEQLTVPDKLISIDIVIPRNVFENRTDKFLRLLLKFQNVTSYFIELTTGSEGSSELIYTSTSDPVTAIAMYGGAAWGVLTFYKLMLEVAEKQVSLLKAFKELRGQGADSVPGLEEQINSIIEASTKNAVEEAIASVPHKVPQERVNVIKIGINKDAPVILHAVANGATLAITVESLNRLELISESINGLTLQEIHQAIQERHSLEEQLRSSRLSLGNSAPALLTKDASEQ